jgi:hypothetical protein
MDYEILLKDLEENFGRDPFKGQNTDEELTQNDIFSFLLSTIDGDIPVYLSWGGLFLYSIAVPITSLPINLSEISDFNVSVDPSYGYWERCTNEGSPEDFGLSLPGENLSPEFLATGIPLTSLRDYRFNEEKRYIEFPQDFTQMFSLHRDDETRNMCRINRNGDKEAICRMSLNSRHYIVTIKSEVLFAYLQLKQCVLVRVFDCMRSKGGNPVWTKFERIERFDKTNKIFAQFQDNPEDTYHCSFIRGGQYIGLDRNFIWEQAKKELVYVPDDRFCDFICFDWKNNRITSCNCSEKTTSNYFEPKNDKPFGTSPVFFKPEVLDKYKNRPDVYILESRSVSKIDGWELKTFDINEHGQVHSYLCYLAHLPYEEQLYWKSFNEEPKGPISKRAYETDFEGNWSDFRNPDEILITQLERLKSEIPFYHSLEIDAIRRINRVHTDNEKEWGDSLLLLDQIVIESIDNSVVQSLANKLGCLDPKLGSIKQLQNIFLTLGYDNAFLEPLSELHYLRSKIKGHKQGTEAKEIINKIRKEHGSFQVHSLSLLSKINESIDFIIENFKEINTAIDEKDKDPRPERGAV